MTNWLDLLKSQHEIQSEGAEDIRLLLGDPTSRSDISEIGTNFGLSFPTEFQSFYSEFNGAGATYHKKSGDEEDWLFLPTDRIKRLSELDVDWDSDLHKNAAERLIVFIDLGTGDCGGYQLNENGSIGSDSICFFCHARINFEPLQPPEEFIIDLGYGIEGLLKDHEWNW